MSQLQLLLRYLSERLKAAAKEVSAVEIRSYNSTLHGRIIGVIVGVAHEFIICNLGPKDNSEKCDRMRHFNADF